MKWFILVILAAGVLNCKSAPTTKETVQAVDDLDDVDEFIDESDAPPEKKAAAKEKTANAKTVIVKQGETIVRQAEEIDVLEKWRDRAIGFIVCFLLAAGAFIYFKVKSWLAHRAASAAAAVLPKE